MPCDVAPRFRLGIASTLWRWKPHPTQLEWLLSDARTKVASCGRRWGKTEAAAIDAATLAFSWPGSIQMVVSPTYDQSRLIFDLVESLMLRSGVTRGITKVVRTPYPRLLYGRSLIMARTADEDGRNLRGHAADRVIVDEAAYIRDKVIQEVIRPMLADRDGRLVMISTPFGKNHFYRAFLRGAEGGDGRYRSFTFPSMANPHVSHEYIEEQRRELSPRQFAVEYEAQFLDDQNAVFAWDDIRRAVFAKEHGPNASPRPDFEAVVAGIDWARYSDYTAVVAVGVSDGLCDVVGMERISRLGWSAQIERVCGFLLRHRVNSVLTDQTSIGDPLLEQLTTRLRELDCDVRVEGVVFTNRSKRDLVDDLALRFGHGTVTIPGDEHLLRELQYFEYEVTESGNVRLGARGGYHDDLVIALALACKQARAVGSLGGCLSAGGRLAGDDSW